MKTAIDWQREITEIRQKISQSEKEGKELLKDQKKLEKVYISVQERVKYIETSLAIHDLTVLARHFQQKVDPIWFHSIILSCLNVMSGV